MQITPEMSMNLSVLTMMNTLIQKQIYFEKVFLLKILQRVKSFYLMDEKYFSEKRSEMSMEIGHSGSISIKMISEQEYIRTMQSLTSMSLGVYKSELQ